MINPYDSSSTVERDDADTRSEHGMRERIDSSLSLSSRPKKRSQIRPKRRTFELKPVYDDPDHELLAPPVKKTRPTNRGETLADFLVFGDCLSWGFSHKLHQSRVESEEQLRKEAAEKPSKPVEANNFFYPQDKQYKWTTYLENKVKAKGLRIIENNMINRTTAYDDPDCGQEFMCSVSRLEKRKLSTSLEGRQSQSLNPRSSTEEVLNQEKLATEKLDDTASTGDKFGNGKRKKRKSKDTRGDEVQEAFLAPPDFNGHFHFGTFFSSNSPLWVVFFLGTHDLKKRVRKANPGITAEHIAENVAQMALEAHELFTGHCHFGSMYAVQETVPPTSKTTSKQVLTDAQMASLGYSQYGLTNNKKKLNIVLVAPPRVRLTKYSRALGFDEKSVALSKELPLAFKTVCEKYGFIYAHRNLSMRNSEDGIHMTKRGCQKLADAVWSKIFPHFPREVKTPRKYAIQH